MPISQNYVSENERNLGPLIPEIVALLGGDCVNNSSFSSLEHPAGKFISDCFSHRRTLQGRWRYFTGVVFPKLNKQ